ncbi:MAG: hypothetical protein HAW67_07495, partial [Endozoicomonadaceae bacterium]|nr:hypothetical protein [Endozoicomonadaceae bacterium]
MHTYDTKRYPYKSVDYAVASYQKMMEQLDKFNSLTGKAQGDFQEKMHEKNIRIFDSFKVHNGFEEPIHMRDYRKHWIANELPFTATHFIAESFDKFTDGYFKITGKIDFENWQFEDCEMLSEDSVIGGNDPESIAEFIQFLA